MKDKINLVLIVVLVLVGIWTIGSFSKKESNQKKEKIKNIGRELVASGHPAWPPIMYQEGNDISGSGVDLAQKILSELGVNMISRYEGNWDEVQQKTKDGSIDLLVAAYKTPEREKYMEYSIPYTADPIVLVVKKGKSFPYAKWEDLSEKRGVVTVGDSYGEGFDNFIKNNLNPEKVETPDEAFALLEKGTVDYFVYALYSAEGYLFDKKAKDKFEILPQQVSTENFYFTISKKSPFIDLMPEINALLYKYREDGSIEKMINEKRQELWGEE